MGEGGEAGIVAVGAYTDLILLATDPIDDLDALRYPIGIMVNGVLHDRSAIDKAMVDQAANTKSAQAPE